MPTSFPFNGKIITLPGAYSTIKSGIRNPPIALPYGNILVIDTGSGAGYGGGSGINGTLAKGKSAFYEFDNIYDFQNFAKGGLWWLLAQPLFRPNGVSSNGISKITYVKAATTTPASFGYTFYGDGDGSSSASGHQNGGTLVIQVTDEGVVGNGVLDSNNNLISGFAAKMSAGTIDPTKFVLTFYRSGYKGLDQNGLPYDGIYSAGSTPIVLAQSIEFSNIADLITWMQTDATFLQHFKLASSTVVGTGAVDSADLAESLAFNIATGGTENYTDPTLLDTVLTNSTDLLVNFIMSDQFGTNVTGSVNTKLEDFVTNRSKWKPELYVGAGDDVNTFAASKAACAFFNNDSVSVVHGAIYKNSLLGQRTYNVLYKTAAILGREAGLAPQVPITFKSIDIDGEVHILNDQEATQALNAGLLVTRLDSGAFEIVKGVNSLQNNQFLVNDDGTISSKQIKRITRQLNIIIQTDAKTELFKQPNGVNRNTLSVNDVISWAGKKLTEQKISPAADNLIISFQDIDVTRTQDAYNLSYKITPNSEISFLFSTGSLIGI